MALNSTVLSSTHGAWGPVTATLDWCEANYQFSYYVAEMANTISNLFSIIIAILGYNLARQESLPTRYFAGYIGFGFIGIGSFFFHASLLFQAQLADELPMIYVASYSLFIVFDKGPGFNIHTPRARSIIASVLLFDVLFTWSYYLYRNPVYHQLVFGSLVSLNALRVAYLLKSSETGSKIPEKVKATIGKLFTTGAFVFVMGFLVWNLDNIFCDTLTRWKVAIGWPLAFLLEGHSWWHVLTGTGVYLKFMGMQYVTLCVKDDYRNYTIGHVYGLPYVKRVGATVDKKTT